MPWPREAANDHEPDDEPCLQRPVPVHRKLGSQLAAVVNRELPVRLALGYAAVQFLGAISGVWLAHLMFDFPILQAGARPRTGVGQWVSEGVAMVGMAVGLALVRMLFGKTSVVPDSRREAQR